MRFQLWRFQGIFQADRNEWSTPPRGAIPPNSSDDGSGAIKTPFSPVYPSLSVNMLCTIRFSDCIIL